MKDNISQVMQRARRYWHIDGLTEMALGSLFLVLGLYFFAQSVFPTGSLLYQILDVSFVLIVVGVGLLANRMVEMLKERLTYPRTGLVTYPQPKGLRRWITPLIAIAIAMVMSLLFRSAPPRIAWMPLASGVVIALVMFFLGFRLSLLRFHLVGFTSLVTGSLIAITGLENQPGLALYYALMGIALCISGGLTLRSYLLHTESEGNHE